MTLIVELNKHPKIVDLYNNGNSLAEIASKYKSTKKTIKKILEMNGVDIRRGRKERNTHSLFLKNIKINDDGCWEWQGIRLGYGYGTFAIDNKTWRTHRYSYQYYKGDIGGYNVLHKCDNPPCCNPDHLFLGTQKDNVIDIFIKRRHSVIKLTHDDVIKIRELYYSGTTPHKISELLRLKKRTIWNVISGRSWSYIK
jgi:hypothetical protein